MVDNGAVFRQVFVLDTRVDRGDALLAVLVPHIYSTRQKMR